MVNYEDNRYHIRRHPELLEDEDLRQAWSCFADVAYFGDVPPGAQVLEYGGGLGNNLLTVAKRAQTWMVEPAEIGRDLARKAGINVASHLGEIAGRQFDIILCRHVLEHVDDPLVTLKQIHQALKPDGRLILVVPCESIKALPSEEDLDHHMYCWSPRTLGNLLERADYRVTRTYFEYFGAKRRLLPLYQVLGGNAYARAVRLVGRIFRFKELVIDAGKAVHSIKRGE
jgi:SAM-dependent methyltransferase